MAHFYWRGGIVWGLDGPYVEPGTHTLVARFSGTIHTWNATTTMSVDLGEGSVPPTIACGQNGSPARTHQDESRIQLLYPDDWPSDHWVCVEAWFVNRSNQTFVTEIGDYVRDISIYMHDADGEQVWLAPPILPPTAAPAHRTFEVEPGGSVSVVQWWYPEMGSKGVYGLSASFPTVSETWPTKNETTIRVV